MRLPRPGIAVARQPLRSPEWNPLSSLGKLRRIDVKESTGTLMHVDGHAHSASHADNHSHAHNHVEPDAHSSRRDFFRLLTGGALAGASVLELGFHRAAWARAAAPTSGGKLFDIQKAANGVFFAHARAQARVNCNAAIFVRSKDVVVVDAHSKPSAAASLIAQIKREVTEKPVRYIINTHFHWDHIQGNHAYRMAESQIDFIATATTKKLMQGLSLSRLKESLDLDVV